MFSKHKLLRSISALVFAFALLSCGSACAEGNDAKVPSSEASVDRPGRANASESADTDGSDAVLKRANHRLKERTVSLKRKTKLYTVDISYPQFSGANKVMLDQLNARITKDVAKVANDWIIGLPKKPPMKGLIMELTGNTEVAFATPEYVSAQLGLESCTGGAHPNHFGVPLNYGLSPLREITIKFLFDTKKEMVMLSEITRKALYDQEISTKDQIDEGTKPFDKNFDLFTFDSQNLEIVFQEYQVGPYLAGMPSVKLSYDKELKPLVAGSTILEHIIRSQKRFLQPEQ